MLTIIDKSQVLYFVYNFLHFYTNVLYFTILWINLIRGMDARDLSFFFLLTVFCECLKWQMVMCKWRSEPFRCRSFSNGILVIHKTPLKKHCLYCLFQTSATNKCSFFFSPIEGSTATVQPRSKKFFILS